MSDRIACSVTLVIGLAAAAAAAAPPTIQIDWSVNGGPVNTLWPDGVGESGSTMYSYSGSNADPLTGIELVYDLEADPYSGLGGNLQVFNDLKGPIDLSVQIVMEFTPVLVEGSELSGEVAIGLVTGAGGGQISSQPPALWRAVIDDSIVGPQATLFYHPFLLANSGQGSSSTQQKFGVPVPVPGPPISQNVGYTLAYTLTSFDTASITSSFNAGGEPLTCLGDLNIGGSVGPEDLNLMLAAWGACGGDPCDADLDGDGEVGILDLLALLATWGPCG